MVVRRLVILILTVMTVQCEKSDVPRQTGQGTRLTAEQCEAIRLAEQFVVDNGYAAEPASADESRIGQEVTEYGQPRDFALSLRRNTLDPHAIGLYPIGASKGEHGWAIAFGPSRIPDASLGLPNREPPQEAVGQRAEREAGARVVCVYSASAVHMQHQPVLLANVDIRFGSGEARAKACPDLVR